ncbi:MAG: hypothetical protein ACHQT9_03005 [Candidatus Saccharimonadales bacterium]
MNGIVFINWLYFVLSLLLIGWACHQIWHTSQQKDKGRTHYQKHKKRSLSGIRAVANYIWRKHYRLSILIVALVASWGLVYADNLLPIDNIPAKDELSSLLLLATAAVVFWYTRETFDLKVITQNAKSIQQSQFDFENRPYLRLQWSRNGDEVLQIVNDGKGLARDVCFEPIDIEQGVPFAPFRRPVIAAGQYTTISQHELQTGASKTEVNGYADYIYNVKTKLDDKLKAGDFGKLHITYLDLRDQVYDAVFVPDERYNDRFNIESQAKRK